MRIYLDCYPCFLGQALRAARLSGADERQQFSVMQGSLALLQELPPGVNPPEVVYQVQQLVRGVIDAHDPYEAVKQASTQQALALYPRLKALVQHSADPLATAIRLSIAGNIIDFALSDQVADLWETVERVLQQPYAIDDTALLKARLATVPYVLFIADNAGESVFDRVLIETLPVPVIYVVKGSPVVNDVTMKDAIAAGIDTCAEVIDTGAQASGTILALCSETFRQRFADAPLVIAKGQANFETLGDAGPKVFCLLQVKCNMIGVHLGVPVGSIVARQSQPAAPQP